MTMRRGHHTSRVLKAMGAGPEDAAANELDPVESVEERVTGEPE
jgi:hypothetical protein